MEVQHSGVFQQEPPAVSSPVLNQNSGPNIRFVPNRPIVGISFGREPEAQVAHQEFSMLESPQGSLKNIMMNPSTTSHKEGSRPKSVQGNAPFNLKKKSYKDISKTHTQRLASANVASMKVINSKFVHRKMP